ncbi:DUF2813 domain-containing protein, partial [Escherichia coli]|uniref:DUF2813 domain-containing protein n=1 Tax=Escherichia coli TaxID=562 RepID=UPI001E579CB2
MILERVEIVGFRGINRLSLMLEQNNVLIGENAWGKSSLHYTVNQTNDYMGQPAVALNQIYWIYLSG